jgi:hypothetical protein
VRVAGRRRQEGHRHQQAPQPWTWPWFSSRCAWLAPLLPLLSAVSLSVCVAAVAASCQVVQAPFTTCLQAKDLGAKMRKASSTVASLNGNLGDREKQVSKTTVLVNACSLVPCLPPGAPRSPSAGHCTALSFGGAKQASGGQADSTSHPTPTMQIEDSISKLGAETQQASCWLWRGARAAEGSSPQ